MKMVTLIMAAGRSLRFGSPKQLAMINGEPLVLQVWQQCQQALLKEVYLVLGANESAIRHLLPEQVKVMRAGHWQQGLGNSIADACQQVLTSTTHIQILLADQLAIKAYHLQALARLSKQYPDKIICTQMDRDNRQSLCPPAIFPHWCFEQLKQLQGDKGAKSLLQQWQQQLKSLAIPEAEIDVDTPADLEQFN
jgi:molybdenum cofactor cytidylyltransferase